MHHSTTTPAPAFTIEGHRGARGLAPENTLPSFARALAIGVHGFELDLGISSDDNVVVVHDRYLSPHLHRSPGGRWIDRDDLALRWLSLDELKLSDAGRLNPDSEYARKFPEQQPADGARIPTLAEVVALVARRNGDALRFGLELKYSPLDPDSTVPPEAFAARVVREVHELGIARRTTVLCFYWPLLREVRRLAPDIATACLSCEQPGNSNVRPAPGVSPWTGMDADCCDSVAAMVAACGAVQWSPFHRDLERAAVKRAHDLGLRVVPWSVNDPGQMRRLIGWRVDGIITDYPDRLRRVAGDCGLALPRRAPL